MLFELYEILGVEKGNKKEMSEDVLRISPQSSDNLSYKELTPVLIELKHLLKLGFVLCRDVWELFKFQGILISINDLLVLNMHSLTDDSLKSLFYSCLKKIASRTELSLENLAYDKE